VLAEARALAAKSGGSVTVSHNTEAVKGAGAIYTDTWVSMGDESEKAARAAAFTPYRVTGALMTRAAPDAFFMHCLPAHRGEEVTNEVIDSKASIVYDQAENRMHLQNALLLSLMAGK
jgi:ornithine carbamoyltransferase